MIKWLFLLSLFTAMCLFALPFAVTRIENVQHAQNREQMIKNAAHPLKPKTAVIYFSRSGNTGVLAQHIAQSEQADLFEIGAEDYALGIPGWMSALKDARKNVARISPTKINLNGYDKVYLGAPIWLYSPAPPIWQFVQNADLTEKDVILFNSFNSKFEQRFIDDFGLLVQAKGAKSFAHQYIKRGRMGSQITTEQMLADFDSQQPK
ncbi:flavodoxin family protein [Shewanella mangrovisoli]|uniref:flavodoxin family protein n=1 Tax=Shewanella mangrovisoli TaxID=2864211 RepID=UPI00370A8049